MKVISRMKIRLYGGGNGVVVARWMEKLVVAQAMPWWLLRTTMLGGVA